jgi:acetate kinase
MDAGQLTDLLYGQSGLAGVSGLSGDMRKLLASGEPGPKLALALYCRRAGQIGAGLAAMMGGIDAVVFTGGIGENAPTIRGAIAAFLSPFGLRLDAAANEANGEAISPAEAKIEALVLPANEERIIAQEMAAILKSI